MKIKIKKLEKNKVNTDSLREDRNEFIKSSKLILKDLKATGMFFSETVNNNALSANYDKRIQLIDSVEIYAYETSKDLIR